MQSLRGVCIGIAVFGMIAIFSGISFAEEGHHACKEGKENEEVKIKLMKDSAAVLQQSKPDLAKGLSEWAADEEKEAQEWKEKKAKHEAKTKLLTDSATALGKANPDLAKGLKEMAEKKHECKKSEMMEKDEKEEAGEEMESKGEK